MAVYVAFYGIWNEITKVLLDTLKTVSMEYDSSWYNKTTTWEMKIKLKNWVVMYIKYVEKNASAPCNTYKLTDMWCDILS